MHEHKSTGVLSSNRQEILDETETDTGLTWALNLESSRRLGWPPEETMHVQIRVALALVWVSVMGMWLSFPVVDLEASISRLGAVLLHYQNLANLDRPLTSFLLSSMAFSLTSVAVTSKVVEVEGPLEGSLATFLVVGFLAIFAGLYSGVTPLQNLVLVLPLSTVSALTAIIIFKGTLRQSRQKALQYAKNSSYLSPKSGRNDVE